MNTATPFASSVSAVRALPTEAELTLLKCSCDGQWPGSKYVCFTDKDPQSPAYGASFDLALPVSLRDLQYARNAKRRQFAEAKKSHTKAAKDTKILQEVGA